MLSFEQLERRFALLETISRYEQVCAQTDAGLNASVLDGMPRSTGQRIDTLGDIVIKQERAREKLARLRAVEKAWRPEVERTIVAVARKGPNAVQTELICRMRYIEGKSWTEIGELFHEPREYFLSERVRRLFKAQGGL